MTQYAKWVEEFFTRYEEPTVDDFIVGFSGIDPPLKSSVSEINHEKLNNLLGGRNNEHYHLTRDQYERALKIIDGLPDPGPSPEPDIDEWTIFDGGTSSTTESEYQENLSHWLDGGFSPNNHSEEFDGGKAA